MVDSRRYFHHLGDIAVLKDLPLPLCETFSAYLEELEAEAKEFEREKPGEANRLRARFKEDQAKNYIPRSPETWGLSMPNTVRAVS